MKRCRCCRQTWPIEFYAPVGRWRRSTCSACRAGCKRFRERYYIRHRDEAIARTKAYRSTLRAEIERVRSARMSVPGDGCEPNTLRSDARSSAITRERASLISVEVTAR